MASPFLFLIILIFLPFLLLFVVLIFLVRPSPAKIPIANRHVFITGGSSGIGFALALKTASEGARVSILARNRNKLEESRKAILLATGVEIGVYSADVRDPEAVQEVIDSVGEIDVLVVNHGVFLPRELDEEELEEVRFMVEVNVMGSFHVIKAALKGMKRRGTGRGPRSIAIMSSQAGQVGVYGYTAYCASKFALRGLGEALQQEVIEDDIHVSIIFPPDTKTPGLDLENSLRPDISRVIAGYSVEMKAESVAEKTLNGIKSGSFIVTCNFEGLMLSIATAGFSPQRSYIMAFCEILGASFMRFVGLCFVWNWYGIVKNCTAAATANKKIDREIMNV